MAALEQPVHPLHLAVREGVTDQLQLLVADAGELLGNLHDRAVELAHHPTLAIGVGAELCFVALASAQLHQPLEPLLQGAGGMACVRPAFLNQVEQRVRQSGALLIADEVLTGFGRTGSLFAFQQASIQPDLIALSKGLTGGFLPMGVTLAREGIYQGFLSEDPGRTFWHGHSFTANPLGCAAANASLDLLEQQPERYRQMAERHRPHLETLAQQPLVQRPRLLGTMAAFDLATDQPGYLNPAGKVLQAQARARGVFVRPLGSVVYLLPPLCITDQQLEQCYAALNAALQAL